VKSDAASAVGEKSLYAQYIFERENIESIERRWGFAYYKFEDESCYIVNIYVLPEYRKQYAGSSFADMITEIAKERGCTCLLGSCDPELPGADESVKAMFAYGFKLSHINGPLIILKKEI
jgi:GNAT superfamily N-acetyltransferase